MCGICGFYEYGRRQSADGQIITNMLHVIHHRGPDDAGVHIEEHAAIAMRRLSIIDLPGGKQPISNEDGSVVVVFNGEIYNYLELRQQLLARGHKLTTNSDTEVIVHLYEESGADCVRDLRGMFGFALWDKKRQRLLLARDRLGIKPLYYADFGERVVFGSEIKAILQHPDVEPRLRTEALSHFLSLKYVPAPQTMFEGIFALPPGHIAIVDKDGLRTKPYWKLSFQAPEHGHASEAESLERLEALLKESVRLHLISDVPFGAFLSGGVDSSTIVALMSQTLDQPVKTFSVGFEGEGASCSELKYARMVAKHFETDHREVLMGPQDLTDLAERVIWHLDQPVADNACIANYMVSELASDHVKMVLTGEGADELFAGYARYAGERFSPLFQFLPRQSKEAMLSLSGRLPGLRRQKLALYALCQSNEVSRLTNWFPLFNRGAKEALLSHEFRQAVQDPFAESVFAEHLAATDADDPLSRMLYVDTKLWLPDDLLARGDKMSMAASIEGRVPLLDHKLVEFAASLPSQFKLKGLARKYLLKKVARRWLPNEVIDRKKEGFPMPFSIWFRKTARPFVRDLLSADSLRRRGIFNPAYVETLLHENETGFANHGPLLWGLLSVELWHRVFLDSAQSSQGVPIPSLPIASGVGGDPARTLSA